jgi:FtsH-binding integral membrane protein
VVSGRDDRIYLEALGAQVTTIEVGVFKVIDAVTDFIKADYKSHKLRLVMETLGLLIALVVSVTFAWTTPHPPLLACYVLWLISAAILGGTSWHRGSFGLTALYGSFLVIDGVGFIRTLLA